MTRREELKEIFKDVDKNERKLVQPLIDEVIFLEDQMMELKRLPFISVNPKIQLNKRKLKQLNFIKSAAKVI